MERWAVRPTGHLIDRSGKLRNEHQGTLGWLGLAAGVAVFDALAKETMSHAADRAMARKYGKFATVAAVATVALHLVNGFDKAGIPDPMTKIVGKIRRRT